MHVCVCGGLKFGLFQITGVYTDINVLISETWGLYEPRQLHLGRRGLYKPMYFHIGRRGYMSLCVFIPGGEGYMNLCIFISEGGGI